MLGAEKGTLVRWGRCWWRKTKCLDKGPRKVIGNTPEIVADEIQQTYGNTTLTRTHRWLLLAQQFPTFMFRLAGDV